LSLRGEKHAPSVQRQGCLERELPMTFKRNHMKWGVIAVMLGAILAVHYFTYLAHGNMRYEHSIHRMLFYLPLVLGSVWFGLKGALCVAAAVIVCNLPYAILSWEGLTPEDFDILLQAMLLVIVGILLGFLVEKERAKHKALVQAESLAAVGRAVSEIAHDMKSPLIAIGGFTSQVLRSLSPGDPNCRRLEAAVSQTARLEGMVREMLYFGRPLELNRTKVDLNEVVKDALELSQPLAAQERVNLKAELDARGLELMLDETRVSQVLLNLISNAIQASESGEEVCVRTKRDHRAVFLEVSDSGCGIAAEDRAKIFQPFFSTRKDGTGLGLAASKKVIDAHGGKIGFYENSPKGTTFAVRFQL
jgi:two-component system, NtrC family, sensor histidine kinase HydH